MIRLPRLTALILISIVFINAVSVGVVAQRNPNQVPLDNDITELAEVHTNGQTYMVYEVENAFPYASGIEVYADGERITSTETVDEVFKALARRKATKFEPENQTIQRLQRVIERSQTIQTATGNALRALNETLEYRESLKQKTVNDTSAWEVAIENSEALDEGFAGGMMGTSTAVELRNKLLTIRTAAADLEANATRVITLLEQRQAGEEISQSALYRRYDAIYAELNTMKQQVDEVSNQLSSLADTSRTAGKQAGSVSQVGTELERRMTSLAESLQSSSERFSEAGPALTDLRQSLPKVTTNVQYQEQLTDRWQTRQSALMKVYVTLGEGVIFLIAGIIALGETRQ